MTTPPIEPLHLAGVMHDEIRRRLKMYGFDDMTISYRKHWLDAPKQLRKILIDAADATIKKLTDCDMTHEDLLLPPPEE